MLLDPVVGSCNSTYFLYKQDIFGHLHGIGKYKVFNYPILSYVSRAMKESPKMSVLAVVPRVAQSFHSLTFHLTHRFQR